MEISNILDAGCVQSVPTRSYPNMESTMTDQDTPSIEELLERVRNHDPEALAEVFAHYRDRLRRMVRLRLDRRLQGRVDPSDVLQEAYLDVAARAAEYAAKPEMPFFLWLRMVTGQRLLETHRRHLQTKMRDATQEVSLYGGALPQANSMSLAAQLLGRLTTASTAAMRSEMQIQLQQVLNAMDSIDREVLALRHFEELSNGEIATILNLSKAATSNRYVRALKRLKDDLSQIPDFFD
jgi:RNA polymerase sigma-70 factor (ECF subfamily)